MAASDASQHTTSITRLLLWCGAVAGPLFIAMFLLEGAMAAHYNPLRHPVSSLALAPAGWLQVANFLMTGTLYLAFAAGLWRTPSILVGTRVGVILIAAAAVGLLGSGVFLTDPVSGYPPGTPDTLGDYTTAGALHDLFAIPTFLGIPAAQIAFGSRFLRRRNRGWALYSIGSAVAMLVALVCTNVAFNQVAAIVDFGGLLQRITIGIGFAWLTALATHTLAAMPTE